MSYESQIPRNQDGQILAPCHMCGVEILTSDVMYQVEDDGSLSILMAHDACSDCEAELERRRAEYRVREAEAKARYEKSLADLIASIPKPKHEQAELDMGLD